MIPVHPDKHTSLRAVILDWAGTTVDYGSLATWGCPGGVAAGPCGIDARALDAAGLSDEARFAPMMSLGVGLRF